MTSSYPPQAYNEADFNVLWQLVREQPLATFIVASNDTPYATPVPLVPVDEHELLGHLDANNPAASLVKDGQSVLAIFHGRNAYISPTDYTTRQLPTYNYEQVHVRGNLRRLENPQLVKADIFSTSCTLWKAPVAGNSLMRIHASSHCFRT